MSESPLSLPDGPPSLPDGSPSLPEGPPSLPEDPPSLSDLSEGPSTLPDGASSLPDESRSSPPLPDPTAIQSLLAELTRAHADAQISVARLTGALRHYQELFGFTDAPPPGSSAELLDQDGSSHRIAVPSGRSMAGQSGNRDEASSQRAAWAKQSQQSHQPQKPWQPLRPAQPQRPQDPQQSRQPQRPPQPGAASNLPLLPPASGVRSSSRRNSQPSQSSTERWVGFLVFAGLGLLLLGTVFLALSATVSGFIGQIILVVIAYGVGAALFVSGYVSRRQRAPGTALAVGLAIAGLVTAQSTTAVVTFGLEWWPHWLGSILCFLIGTGLSVTFRRWGSELGSAIALPVSFAFLLPATSPLGDGVPAAGLDLLCLSVPLYSVIGIVMTLNTRWTYARGVAAIVTTISLIYAATRVVLGDVIGAFVVSAVILIAVWITLVWDHKPGSLKVDRFTVFSVACGSVIAVRLDFYHQSLNYDAHPVFPAQFGDPFAAALPHHLAVIAIGVIMIALGFAALRIATPTASFVAPPFIASGLLALCAGLLFIGGPYTQAWSSRTAFSACTQLALALGAAVLMVLGRPRIVDVVETKRPQEKKLQRLRSSAVGMHDYPQQDLPNASPNWSGTSGRETGKDQALISRALTEIPVLFSVVSWLWIIATAVRALPAIEQSIRPRSFSGAASYWSDSASIGGTGGTGSVGDIGNTGAVGSIGSIGSIGNTASISSDLAGCLIVAIATSALFMVLLALNKPSVLVQSAPGAWLAVLSLPIISAPAPIIGIMAGQHTGFTIGHLLLTICWMGLGCGIVLKAREISIPSIALVIAAIAKLVLFDLNNLGIVLRTIAFLLCGAMLLMLALKKSRVIKADKAPPESADTRPENADV